jgi:hypothetical protein
MTDVPQPTAGSLEARIIRACRDHGNKCKLDCPRRQVEDLGQVAQFDTRIDSSSPSSRSWIVEQFDRFFRKESS